MKVGGRRPYHAYRATGIGWLGTIPEHWTAQRLKDVAEINSETLPEQTAAYYSLQYIDISNVNSNGEIIDVKEMRLEDAPSRARRRVRHGDTIISTVRTYLKAIALIDQPPDNLIASTGFAVLRPRPGVFARYLWRLIQSQEFIDAVVAHSEGVGYPAIAPTKLAVLPTWLPPFAEQRAIADFLDRETARIDALIAKKRRLIELLQEKRTALISHAVTKGLDPDVLMKDSGVEWLGKVPAHWTTTRLMHLTQPGRPIMYGIVLPGPSVEDGVPIVKGGDVAPERLVMERLARTTHEIASRYKRSMLRGNDIVYAIRGSIGAAEIVPSELCGANLTQDAARIAPNNEVDAGWLLYAVRSGHLFAQLDAGALGATIRGINIRDLKRAILPLPPLSEQRGIAKQLSTSVLAIDTVEQKTKAAIDALQEYRTALISAAVTGKIDLRENEYG